MHKDERQIAYINALKAVDADKEMRLYYENALKDLAKAMFDMTDEDFENNKVKSDENDPE